MLATDIGMCWLLMPDADQGATLQPRGAAEPVARVSGTAAELFTALWRRTDPGVLTREGDDGVLTRFLASRHSS